MKLVSRRLDFFAEPDTSELADKEFRLRKCAYSLALHRSVNVPGPAVEKIMSLDKDNPLEVLLIYRIDNPEIIGSSRILHAIDGDTSSGLIDVCVLPKYWHCSVGSWTFRRSLQVLGWNRELRILVEDAPFREYSSLKFCDSLGFREVSSTSVLDLDLRTVKSSGEIGRLYQAIARVAPPYSIETFLGSPPPEQRNFLLSAMPRMSGSVVNKTVGNSGPAGNIWTREKLDKMLKYFSSGRSGIFCFAIARSKLGPCGFSVIHFPDGGTVANQQDVFVEPADRSCGLSSGMQAASIVRLLQERSSLSNVRTSIDAGNVASVRSARFIGYREYRRYSNLTLSVSRRST